MRCGLLGRKLGHSYSPQIHRFFGDYDYCLYEKEPEELEAFLRSGEFDGLNVTIPYKKDVIPFCTELSPVAQKMGAVNTLVRRSDGSLVGHNTDCFGFSSMVARSGLPVSGKKVLVLGSGGASATAQQVVHGLGAQVVVISRTGENNYTNLHLHRDAAVIVNCTPIGMYPHTGQSPLCLDLFPGLEGVLDMVYNPARTQLLMDGENRGLTTQNGLWMLVAQAKESAQWFLDREISDACIEPIYNALEKQMKNVILVGMPGSGKSTVGKLLAQMLNKPFVDADDVIRERAQCSIPEIFARGGEPEFRNIESKVLKSLGMGSGCVIATGGGCVTVPENYPLLHQNGTIVWLQRELSSLPAEGRPLSQATGAEEMYRVRRPMYERFADITLCNDGTPEETAQQIARRLLL